jgi:hypothetical protein
VAIGGKRIPLSNEAQSKILELHRRGFPERQIAFQTQCSRGGVRSILAKHGKIRYFKESTEHQVKALLNSGLTAEQVADQMGTIKKRTVYTIAHHEKQREVMERLKEAPPDLIKQTVDERVAIGKRWGPGRYIVVNDVHLMFHSQEAVNQVLALDGDKFDGCIVAGDFIDEYWASSFRKEYVVSHQEELKNSFALMEMLAEKFGRVLFIPGNHEMRRIKQLLEAFTPVANLLPKDQANTFYMSVNKTFDWYYGKIPNVTIHNNWWLDMCKQRIIIAHADRFNSVPGNAVKAVYEHFLNHRRAYRLGDISAVLQAHLHRMDGPKMRHGIWTWELPAMCPILAYQTGAKASNSASVNTGYSIFATRSDGSLIFNESRSYLIDEWGEPKTSGSKKK